jgi:hypothetical protein
MMRSSMLFYLCLTLITQTIFYAGCYSLGGNPVPPGIPVTPEGMDNF